MQGGIIICIDDEPTVLTSLLGQLEQTLGDQYLYEGFEGPEDALRYIEDLFAEGEDISLVISDWLMPRIKGDELLIRIHQRFPSLPMVMLSGQADPSAVERARKEVKLFQFLPKPWQKERLMSIVQEAIGHSTKPVPNQEPVPQLARAVLTKPEAATPSTDPNLGSQSRGFLLGLVE